MKRSFVIAIAATLVVAGVAGAAPGDFVTVNGTILNQNNDLLVIRADNGTTYYIDARTANRTRPFRQGDAISVAGYEGSKSDQVQAAIIDAGSAGAGLAQGQLNLPPDHRYELYNTGAGTYGAVTVDKVPDLVQRKQPVYDRTAKAWVYQTGSGINPQYRASGTAPAAAPAGRAHRWDRVRGTVQSVNGNVVTLKTDDGRTLNVDIAQARQRLQGGLQAGERVSVIGTASGSQFTARAIRDERQAQASASEWQRVHGTVQSVQGSTMQFRTDDGRTLSVDMSKVGGNIQGALTQGEGATVVGFAGANANQLRAEYIQQDSSDTSRGGAVVGQAPAPVTPAPAPGPTASGPVDQNAWQRVHGTVQSITGTKVTMKADDGRMVTVDVAQVGDSVRKALTPGEGITVAGFFQGNQDTMVARFIQQDSSTPAASPKTK